MSVLHVSQSAELPPAGHVAEVAELWAWALPLALLGSWTCFQAVPGVNWSLWTIATAAGFLVISRRADHSQALANARAAVGLACPLSIAAAITANPVADALIFLAVAGLFAFSVLVTATGNANIGLSALLRAPLVVCRLLLREAATRASETLTIVRMRDAVPVVRGGAMALALAIALFTLLSAADPTLMSWRKAAWDTILSRTFLARDVFFIALTLLVLGGYGLAGRRSKAAVEPQDPGSRGPASPAVRFATVERLMVLGAAMALFVVFFAVELSHQLTSSAVHLAPGETFAEATHRGFGEMIFAAALCALVIITLEQRALRDGREGGVRFLSWAVIAASLLIVASAYQRVRYYEAAYGYTEQRLYVQACCVFICMALICLAWELRSAVNMPRLIRHVALVAIAGIAGLSYWNHSAWIVTANIGRYAGTGKLDTDYLARLARNSPDAIPALIGALGNLSPADALRVRESLRLASPDRSILIPPPGTGNLLWYEWSLRRAASRSALIAAHLLDGSAR